MALEEHLRPRNSEVSECVTRTWTQVGASIAEEFPLLTQLLEAVREESDVSVDAPLQAFWEEHGEERLARIPEVDHIAQLLSLATMMCVIAGEMHTKPNRSISGAAPEGGAWAVDAVTLGAADILMARFFAVGVRVPAAVSADCSRALSQIFLGLCAHIGTIDRLLYDLAADFRAAARTCVARAA